MPVPRLYSVLRQILTTALVCALGLAHAPAAEATQATPSVNGTVVDTSGRAMARVDVRLVQANRTVGTTETSADGRFTLQAPAAGCAGCVVEATAINFDSARIDLLPGGTVRIVMSPAAVREALTVTATRSDTTPAIGGSSTSVISGADIARRGAPVLSELLRATPGAIVTPSGGLGTVTSLFVRGGESDYNKVLLDGIPLNEPGGAFNFANFTTGAIDRVEIVRGAMSALFGSDAMSSVIQIFSARGASGEAPRVSAFVEGGGYGTRRMDGSVAGGAGRWDYSLSGGRFDTDNRVVNNAFGNTTFAASAGGPLDAGGRLTLRTIVRGERQRVGVPGQTAFGQADMDAFFERNDTAAGVSLQHRASARWQQRAAFSVSDSRQTSTNLVADPPFTPSFGTRRAAFEFYDFTLDTHNTFRRFTTSYQADWRAAERGTFAHVVTLAADSDTERATLDDRMADTTLEAARDNVGLSIQHQFTGPRLSTSASLRLEHNASFGNAVVPRGSIGVVVRDSQGLVGTTTVRASAGLGIKEPSMLESFSQNFYFRGNPDLESERSKMVDAGVEQELFSHRAAVSATWFDSRYRNQISATTIDFTTFEGQFFNIGRTMARGIELSGTTRPVAELEINAGYTFLASRIVESTSSFSPVFAEGAWTFRRPRHSGFIRASYATARAGVDVSGLFSGRHVDSDFAGLEPALMEANLPAIWSLGARYSFTRRISLVLRVENLTDADYMNPLGYETWRRTAHVGLRLAF